MVSFGHTKQHRHVKAIPTFNTGSASARGIPVACVRRTRNANLSPRFRMRDPILGEEQGNLGNQTTRQLDLLSNHKHNSDIRQQKPGFPDTLSTPPQSVKVDFLSMEKCEALLSAAWGFLQVPLILLDRCCKAASSNHHEISLQLT